MDGNGNHVTQNCDWEIWKIEYLYIFFVQTFEIWKLEPTSLPNIRQEISFTKPALSLPDVVHEPWLKTEMQTAIVISTAISQYNLKFKACIMDRSEHTACRNDRRYKVHWYAVSGLLIAPLFGNKATASGLFHPPFSSLYSWKILDTYYILVFVYPSKIQAPIFGAE